MNLKLIVTAINNICSFFALKGINIFIFAVPTSNSLNNNQLINDFSEKKNSTSFTDLENDSNDNNKNLSNANSFFHSNSEIHKLSLQEISSISLNRHAIEILIFILKHNPTELLMKDIAIGLNLNKNHLSKIIFDLLAKGLIIKKQNISDVRSNCVEITDKGLDVLYSIWFDLEHIFH